MNPSAAGRREEQEQEARRGKPRRAGASDEAVPGPVQPSQWSWSFFLDHDVPVSVGKALRRKGHQCWTAGDAGLATEPQDDNLTIYAEEHGAVLVTMDREFSQRRRRNSIGRHIWLRCLEPEAAVTLSSNLDEVLAYLQRDNVVIIVSKDGVKADSGWR